MPATEPVVMEGVRLVFRNFRGEASQYNAEGHRNFGVILPQDVAEQMAADGWNVKTLSPRDEDEDGVETPWLPIKLRYDVGKPPSIFLITDRGRTALREDTVEQLDWVDIRVDEATGQSMVDLIVRPYNYTVRGQSGVAAYLQSMYVTIDEDPLAAKYAEMQAQ
jgi:hypothetical protein